jgi:TfoX N-terminal domain
MSVDAVLAERVRDELMGEAGLVEKAMFGGLAFLLDGNMTVGITSTAELMVRVGPDGETEALAAPPVRHDGPSDEGLDPRRAGGHRDRSGAQRLVRQGVAFARGLPAKR